MDILARVVSERRIRLREYFQDFDRLRSGLITAKQFERVLSTAHLLDALPPGTSDEIAASFLANGGGGAAAAAGGGDRFHYDAFLSALEGRIKDSLLTSPAAATIVGGGAAASAAGSPVKALSEDGEVVVSRALASFAHIMKCTGLDPRVAFRDFDSHNTGKVAATRFQRSFPFKTDARTLSLLEKRYSADATNSTVNYLQFCRDLSVLVASSSGTLATAAESSGAAAVARGPQAVATTAETVQSDLAKQLAANRVRIEEYFIDVDKVHRGVITATQFCSALGRLSLPRFHLSQESLAALLAAYESPSASGSEKQVDYTAFVREVTRLVDTFGGGALPALPAGEATINAQSRSLTGTLSSPEAARQLEAVLERVRTALRTRALSIKPVFHDYDRALTGVYTTRTCTASRFERALAVCGLRLSAAEMGLIETAFRAPSGEINYVDFCTAVEPSSGQSMVSGSESAAQSVGAAAAAAAASPKRAPVTQTLQSVLSTVAAEVRRRGIRVTEFMRDFDPLRSGAVSESKFASGMSIAGVRLDDAAIELLVSNFQHPTRAKHVNIPPFIAAIEEQSQALDATSTCGRDGAFLGQVEQQAQDDVHLAAVLERLRAWVKHRCILLPPFFIDCDSHHSGRVTESQFRRVLKRHALPVTDIDVARLLTAFRDPAMPTHIAYRPFITAIDDTENIELVKKGEATKAGFTSSQLQAVALAGSKATEASTAADIVARVAARTHRGARASEFFRDVDPLRHGHCHRGRFTGAIDALGVRLTASEVEIIVNAYRAPAPPSDHVLYNKFLDDVQTALANGDHFSPAATTTFASSAVIAGGSPVVTSTASGAELLTTDPFLSRLVQRAKGQAAARRVATRTVLMDHDKLRKGRVTEAQFFSSLSTLGLVFSPQETKALVQALCCGQNDVNYGPFCAIVDGV